MPNRTAARSAKADFTKATGRLPLLRLFSTPLIDVGNCDLPERCERRGASWRYVSVFALKKDSIQCDAILR
jgi:hypothetical protein